MLDESMHKSTVSLGVDGGGKHEKEDVMAVSVNNLGHAANDEGVVVLSKVVSIIGVTFASAIGPFGS